MNWFGQQFRDFFARWFGPTAETPTPPTVSDGGGGYGYQRRPSVDAERLRRLREEDEIMVATVAAFMNAKANT